MGKNLGGFYTAWIALIAISFVAFLGKGYENSLRGIDSNIHAKVSMSVTSHGFLPSLPIPDPNIKPGHGTADFHETAYFNDHPFFFFWLNGWLMRALGPSGWSARVLTATFSVGCVILTFLLGMTWYSRLYGIVAALFFLFTRDVILTGATASLDPPMMFFILLTFFLWQKKQWFWTGIVAGIGLWIKTPVVLLVFPTASLIALLQGRFQKDFPKIAYAAAMSLAIGSLVWLVTGLLGGWNLVKDYWIRQLWGTTVLGRSLGHSTDWWMFFRMIRNGFLPGLPFLIFGAIQVFRKKLWRDPAVSISLAAIFILFLAITPMRFKMDYYYNPVFPFLAFIAAYSVIDILKPVETMFYVGVSGLSTILMSFLLCFPVSLGPEAFIALKRFMPLIQAYGNCEDEILLISGGEPVGSAMDYKLALDFYTGRTVNVANCESVGSTVRDSHPEWIIVSQENYDRCLTREEQNLYRTRYQVGSQYLLTHIIPEKNIADLTPLERELKPVVDCHPQPYPNDIYHKY